MDRELLLSGEEPAQKVYAWSLVASLIYYVGYSTMAQPVTACGSLIVMDVLLLPAGLTMFTALNIYMNMLLRGGSWTPAYLFWLASALGIAATCGFKTASYMNSKFKNTVGTPPLLWLLQRRQS